MEKTNLGHNEAKTHVLPVVLIREPFWWMQSMVRIVVVFSTRLIVCEAVALIRTFLTLHHALFVVQESL
jgi:hypothetical protein